jgi:hypothetical protein
MYKFLPLLLLIIGGLSQSKVYTPHYLSISSELPKYIATDTVSITIEVIDKELDSIMLGASVKIASSSAPEIYRATDQNGQLKASFTKGDTLKIEVKYYGYKTQNKSIVADSTMMYKVYMQK